MPKGNEQGSSQGKPGGGGGPKKLMVSINSFDGNIKHHPFDATDTIGDVRRFAYDKLVQQKEQITLDRTWIEFNRERIDDGVVLSTLAERQQGGGPEADLTLSLTWDTGGGV
ncbi:MAG TPA: hypothetical protein VF553_20870 [Pyrinomonadaceae bacterium]|jgi:hypothetical protein